MVRAWLRWLWEKARTDWGLSVLRWLLLTTALFILLLSCIGLLLGLALGAWPVWEWWRTSALWLAP